ncbi:MAG: zeta toxin family protein [Rickettsiales bacterium]|nr:zeta toxin family protein [Rickettsiales bacterium]
MSVSIPPRAHSYRSPTFDTLEEWHGYLEQCQPSSHPELVVIGGGSGAGKSVFRHMLKELGIIQSESVSITPELVRGLYPELNKGDLKRHPEKELQNERRYYRYRNALVENCLKRGVSVVLDDHGDNHEALKELMEKVKSYHYETGYIGLFMTPDNYIQRLSDLGITNSKSRDFYFAAQTAAGFHDNFTENARLFDTTLLVETDHNNLHVVAKYETENNELKEVSKDERRMRRFEQSAHLLDYDPKKAVAESPDSPGVVAKTWEAGEGVANPEERLQDRLEISPKVDWRSLAQKIIAARTQGAKKA